MLNQQLVIISHKDNWTAAGKVKYETFPNALWITPHSILCNFLLLNVKGTHSFTYIHTYMHTHTHTHTCTHIYLRVPTSQILKLQYWQGITMTPTQIKRCCIKISLCKWYSRDNSSIVTLHCHLKWRFCADRLQRQSFHYTFLSTVNARLSGPNRSK